MAEQALGTVDQLTAPAGLTAANQTGHWIVKKGLDAAVQVTITGSGVVTGVVDVEVSNGPVGAQVPIDTAAATFTFAAVDRSSDGFVFQSAPWRFIRLKVISIGGSSAKVTGLMAA